MNTRFLSESTDGRPIPLIVDDGSSVTTIHSTPAGTATFDRVYLTISNNSTQTRLVTIKFGGTAVPDDFVPFTVAPDDTIQALIGQPLQNGLDVSGVADGNNCNVTGYVERVVAT